MPELPLILVVEDEYPLQGVVEEALIDGGFETDILSSGEEALTLFRGRVKNYRALVTDVSLKGRISGWEVARQVREIDPGCPVIYMTGELVESGQGTAGRGEPLCLQKPFRIADVLTLLRDVLSDAPAETRRA